MPPVLNLLRDSLPLAPLRVPFSVFPRCESFPFGPTGAARHVGRNGAL